MNKILSFTLVSAMCASALLAKDEHYYIGGITGSYETAIPVTGFDSKPTVKGIEFGQSLIGDEGGVFPGKLTVDTQFKYVVGSTSSHETKNMDMRFLFGNQFDIYQEKVSVGPILGIGFDKYDLRNKASSTTGESVTTMYGAYGIGMRATPVEKLTVSVNAFYKKKLGVSKYTSDDGVTSADYSKVSGYNLEIPVEYMFTKKLGVYAKYTYDKFTFDATQELRENTRTAKLISAGIMFNW